MIKTAKMKEHIKKLFDEARIIKYGSAKYWELRAIYNEKQNDPTYSKEERDNCFLLHKILVERIEENIDPFTNAPREKPTNERRPAVTRTSEFT